MKPLGNYHQNFEMAAPFQNLFGICNLSLIVTDPAIGVINLEIFAIANISKFLCLPVGHKYY